MVVSSVEANFHLTSASSSTSICGLNFCSSSCQGNLHLAKKAGLRLDGRFAAAAAATVDWSASSILQTSSIQGGRRWWWWNGLSSLKNSSSGKMWRLIATSAVETGGAALAAAAATTTSGHWGRWILRRKLLLAVLMVVMIILRVIKVRMMATIFHGRPRFEHHPVDALKGGQNAADGVGEEGALLGAAKLDAQHSARSRTGSGNWPYLVPPLVKGGRRLVVGEGLAHRAVGHHLMILLFSDSPRYDAKGVRLGVVVDADAGGAHDDPLLSVGVVVVDDGGDGHQREFSAAAAAVLVVAFAAHSICSKCV